jgi:methyl-accepting chemotaxis protein
MNIAQKTLAAAAVMIILVLVSSYAGYHGVSSLANTLQFVSGPAWDSADGAMEGTIHLQRQIIELQHAIIGLEEIDEVKQEIGEASESAKESLDRMMAAGLMSDSDVNNLKRRQQAFAQRLDEVLRLLEKGPVQAPQLAAFQEEIHQLLAYLETLEKAGDGKVEAETAGVADTISTSHTIILVAVLLSVAACALIYVAAVRVFVQPLRRIRGSLIELASGDGDLTVRLPGNSHDEVGELAAAFNRFVDKLHASISHVATIDSALQAAVSRMRQAIDTSTQNSDRQFDEIQSIATAMNEMTATFQEVASNAETTARSTRDTQTQCAGVQKSFAQTIRAMETLSTTIQGSAAAVNKLLGDSQNIGSVLDVIKSIAEQTNLLALNAAIEAARAGEQGRGFAVVADEVRTLAQRTQNSTQEIESMISQLQEQAQMTAKDMNQCREQTDTVMGTARAANESLNAINQSVDNINQMNIQISSAVEEQTAVSEDIARNTDQIKNLSESSKEASEQLVATRADMSGLSGDLQKVVGAFRL